MKKNKAKSSRLILPNKPTYTLKKCPKKRQNLLCIGVVAIILILVPSLKEVKRMFRLKEGEGMVPEERRTIYRSFPKQTLVNAGEKSELGVFFNDLERRPCQNAYMDLNRNQIMGGIILALGEQKCKVLFYDFTTTLSRSTLPTKYLEHFGYGVRGRELADVVITPLIWKKEGKDGRPWSDRVEEHAGILRIKEYFPDACLIVWESQQGSRLLERNFMRELGIDVCVGGGQPRKEESRSMAFQGMLTSFPVPYDMCSFDMEFKQEFLWEEIWTALTGKKEMGECRWYEELWTRADQTTAIRTRLGGTLG